MDWLDDQEFYEAMQAYRMAPAHDQCEVFATFEMVKRLLRGKSAATAQWQAEGEALMADRGLGAMFALGAWWADRPWRDRA